MIKKILAGLAVVLGIFMVIAALKPSEYLIKRDVMINVKPMEKMTQDSEFTLTPQGDSTQMTWSVTGSQPFFARLMCTLMFMNMDKYVGEMFVQGLNKLKLIVEAK